MCFPDLDLDSAPFALEALGLETGERMVPRPRPVFLPHWRLRLGDHALVPQAQLFLAHLPTCGPPRLGPGAPHRDRFLTGKECDLNRQCGVINPETKKICTRLLTCKVSPAPMALRARGQQTQTLSKAGSRRGSTDPAQGLGRA